MALGHCCQLVLALLALPEQHVFTQLAAVCGLQLCAS
jgi:hypothetical protein